MKNKTSKFLTTLVAWLALSGATYAQKTQKNTDKTAHAVKEVVAKDKFQLELEKALAQSLQPMEFNAAHHVPGHVMIYLPSWDADKAALVKLLQQKLGSSFVLKNLWSQRDYLLQVDPSQTQVVRDYLVAARISAIFDQFLPNEWQGVIAPNDPYRENYESDYGVNNPESLDLDSLRAFIKPQFRNGQDDAGENVKIVFNELADPVYLGTEIPRIDTTNSYNEYLGNQNFSSPLWTHGSVVVPGATALEDWDDMVGAGPVWRNIFRNINNGTGAVTSLYLNELNWAISYLQANPTKWLVLTKSHLASGNVANVVTALNTLWTLDRCIIVNSAGNAGTNVAEWEEAQNFSRFLSVGATDGTGNKAWFSDRGSWVDVYLTGQGVNGLALGWGWVSIGNNGTSFSAPRIAGLVNVIWNYVGGPSTISASALANKFRNNPKSVQVVQPDLTQKPIPHAFDIMMRFVNNMEEAHPADFDAITEPTIDLKQWTNTALFPQMTWLGANQVRYYIYNGGNRVQLANGILNTNAYGNGAKSFKIEWENNGVLDANAQPTTTEIFRYKNIINANAGVQPPVPVISQLNQFNNPIVCSNAGTLTGKLGNPTGTVTVKHNNVVIPYNAVDSSFTYNPVGGTDTISVLYQNGAFSSTKDSIYTVQAAITPSVPQPAANPNVGTVCENTPVMFTAAPVNVAWATVVGQWYRNGSAIPGATGLTYNFPGNIVGANQQFHYQFTIVPGPGGCYTSTWPFSSPVKTLTVTGNITPTLNNPTATLDTICQGSTTTVSITGNNLAWATYQWYVNGAIGPTGQTANITWLTPPSDTVYCIVTLPAGGCYATGNVLQSNNKIIVVNPVTSPTASPATVNANSGCQGDIFTFNAVTNNLPAWVTYVWKVNGIIQPGFNTSTFTWNSAGAAGGNNAITYQVQLPAGCYVGGNLLNAWATNVNITIPTTPTVSALNATMNTICEGNTTTFSLTAANLPVWVSYQWQELIGGIWQNIIGQNGATYIHMGQPGAGNDTIRCQVILPPGCYTVISPLNSPTQVITVMPWITPTSDVTPNTQNICITQTPNGSWSISALGGANYSHELHWITPNNIDNTVWPTTPGTLVYPAALPAGTNKFYVKSSYVNGATCAVQTVYSDTTVVNVQAQLVPDGTISAPNAVVCDTLNYSITTIPAATTPTGSTATLYKKVGANITPIMPSQVTNGVNPLIFTAHNSFQEQAEYFVVFTPPIGVCAMPANSDTTTVENNQFAKPIVNKTGLNLNYSNAVGWNNQQWQKETAPNVWTDIMGETGLNYNVIANGSYRIASTNGDCTEYSDSVMITNVGINDVNNPGNWLSIYPNPVLSGLVHVGNLPASLTEAKVSLYDAVGKLIYIADVKVEKGEAAVLLPESLAAGVYTLRIKDKKNNKRYNTGERLIIQ